MSLQNGLECRCAGNCLAKRCRCKKTGSLCGFFCHRRSAKCLNRPSQTSVSSADQLPSTSVSSDSLSLLAPSNTDVNGNVAKPKKKRKRPDQMTATTILPSVELKGREEDFDPGKHSAIWHNSNPFTLVIRSGKIKKCHGCEEPLMKDGISPPKFVIRHKEDKVYWNQIGKNCRASVNGYYHCSVGCIAPRHPYFKPREVTASPDVVSKLTPSDIEELKRYGIDGFLA
jgi:hypothetical protein